MERRSGDVRPVPLGLSVRRSFTARPEDTAAAKGNARVEVVSTVSLILMIEEACGTLLQPYFEADDATVGARVAVDHMAPALIGRPIDVDARVASIEGRRYGFAVTIDQDERTVMAGEHVRFAVSLARFLGRTPGAAGPRPEVEFWFDVHSPWCYLASHRVGAIVRGHGGRVRWRPVHLANLSEAIGGRQPLKENAAFVRWYKQDILDQAALLGLPYRQHPNYPLRPSRALRAALWAEGQGAAEPFVQALMRAYWSDEQDISDIAVLARLAAGVGLDGTRVAAAVEDPALKSAIEANVREAIERGLFGVPTAIFRGKLYFGNDHLDLLDRHLGQWRTRQARETRP
jgi:2-hydroxychromene-2-carboxylate isomerase